MPALRNFIILMSLISSAQLIASTPLFISKGVICDKHFCVDSLGLSVAQTERYLGKSKSEKIHASLSEMSIYEFTFSNGVHCDTLMKKCFENRYFNYLGERDGKVNTEYSDWLFSNGSVNF